MNRLLLIFAAVMPLVAWSQTPSQPSSASALGRGGVAIKMINPLSKLFQVVVNDVDLATVPLSAIAMMPGAIILDFESDSGWPAVTQTLKPNSSVAGWTAFENTTTLQPFSTVEALAPLSFSGVKVTFQSAVFRETDKEPLVLDAAKSGAFIVKGLENTMPSGTQGVVVGPRASAKIRESSSVGKAEPVGLLVTFDPPVTAAGFAHFNGDLVIAVLGANHQILGVIRQGARPEMVFSYGFSAKKSSIHALYIGNLYPDDGVLDDLCFVP